MALHTCLFVDGDLCESRSFEELCDGVKEPEEASHEAESRSFEELCDGVKEPEEASHAAECHLMNQETMTEQKATETSSDWLSIPGHDGLKKRVSTEQCHVLFVQCQVHHVRKKTAPLNMSK